MATAQRTLTWMASVTTKMTASGTLDACGVCNGPGAIYECGCSDIPAGDCDCDGNQLDAVGVCGGDCTEDVDADGICDDVDDCVGELMRWAFATAAANRMTAMAFATMRKSADARIQPTQDSTPTRPSTMALAWLADV